MMVYKWAVIGRLRTLVLPGEGVRFSKQDVDRLAIETGVAADPEVQANV